MGVTIPTKSSIPTAFPAAVGCGSTLALTAAPDIISNPTDIVLVLDRSGSMMGTPLADMKLGTRTFIDIIDEATDSSQDGQIGSGSRLGIVSFGNTATADTQLITSVDTLKAAVDSLAAAGTPTTPTPSPRPPSFLTPPPPTPRSSSCLPTATPPPARPPLPRRPRPGPRASPSTASASSALTAWTSAP